MTQQSETRRRVEEIRRKLSLCLGRDTHKHCLLHGIDLEEIDFLYKQLCELESVAKALAKSLPNWELELAKGAIGPTNVLIIETKLDALRRKLEELGGE